MTEIIVSAAAVRAAWFDTSLTTTQAARKLGFAQRSTLYYRAKALGLPPRPKGRPPETDEAMFRRLWAAGVTLAEMARFFDCNSMTMNRTARRLGIPPRAQGGQQIAKTLAQVLDEMRADGLRKAAAAEQRQMILAEMADCIGTVRPVGAEKGRAA